MCGFEPGEADSRVSLILQLHASKLGLKYPVSSVELIVDPNEFVTFSLIRSWNGGLKQEAGGMSEA